MRGTKAKALRKQVYGDMSHRTREYLVGHEPQTALWANPTCICTGLRRKYQGAKRSSAEV